MEENGSRPEASQPQALPGVLAQLARSGELPRETPDLARLLLELGPSWSAIVTEGTRLDQAGWPTRFDAELARRAVARLGPFRPAIQAWLDEVSAWLDGGLDAAALQPRRRVVFAAEFGAGLADNPSSDEEAIQALMTLRPTSSDEERRWCLDARRMDAGERSVCHLAATARVAADGWLAYHAHRRYPSETAVHAAPALRLAMRAGKVTPGELVAWARELVRRGRPHPEALGRSLKGGNRAENLDAFLVEPSLGLYLVVDGQGDRRSTDTATRAFVEGVREAVGAGRHEDALAEAARAAHAAVRAEAPGTVAELAALLLVEGRALIASVGACRCHHARRGDARLLTRDDVLTIGGFDPYPYPDDWSGEPPDPMPRILGGDHPPRVCTRSLEVEPGDTFLLSTDRLAWFDEDESRVIAALEEGTGVGLGRLLDRLLFEGCDDEDDCTALLVRIN